MAVLSSEHSVGRRGAAGIGVAYAKLGLEQAHYRPIPDKREGVKTMVKIMMIRPGWPHLGGG